MKKKILTTLVVVIVTFAMVACGIGSNRELSNDYIIIHQHRGLEVPEIDLLEVTDDDVENMIQAKLMEHIEHRNITDRPSREGDFVTIDFEGRVDGVVIQELSAVGYQLHLGSGVFHNYEGLEEQIQGRNVNENFDVVVQLSEDYSMWAHGMERLDGAAVVFNITLHSISETIFPELTDEWVQANSEESTTVEEYRVEIRNMLEERQGIVNVVMLQQRVFDALMEHVEVIQIPQELLDREIAMQEELYRNIAASQGLEFEDYLQVMWGMDEAMFLDTIADLAEASVVKHLVVELILEGENIQLSEEEIYLRVEQIALMGGFVSAGEYIEAFGEEAVRFMIKQLRVAEFLIEHVQFVEREEEDFDWDAMPEDWPEDWGNPEDWDDLDDWEDWEDWGDPEDWDDPEE